GGTGADRGPAYRCRRADRRRLAYGWAFTDQASAPSKIAWQQDMACTVGGRAGAPQPVFRRAGPGAAPRPRSRPGPSPNQVVLVNAGADVFAALPPHLHEALVRAYVASAAHRELRAGTLDALVRPWLGEEGQPAFYRQIAQADERHTAEVEDGYARLDQPTLVVWGRQDTWLPPERGERLAAAIPGARLRFLEGAGHLVQEDAPAELVAALLDFLR
ncbi:alpha/beta fold hydrolase, partial [Nocardiopsis tropica]|nr:alpha/beta fold hydrolase [Nocardiopsis tropica]